MDAGRLPPWFKVRFPGGENYRRLKGVMRGRRLHTICEEAHCPNIGECWEAGTATFLILGDVCTRACAYCAVTSGRPEQVDVLEPARVASAVREMGLRHAVVTSVNRDDMEDGGAEVFAATIREIRRQAPGCAVEVLIPDFMGEWHALRTVVDEGPDVLNHNIETVARMFSRVRPKGGYRRSMELLEKAKTWVPDMVTKSGIIVGMGETKEEVLQTMADLRSVGCDVLTIGQYLRPSGKHIEIDRFWHPDEFAELRDEGIAMGFRHVESGPLVRSSYHAHKHTGSPLPLAVGPLEEAGLNI